MFDVTKYRNIDSYISSLRKYKFENNYEFKHKILFDYMFKFKFQEKDDFRKEYIHPHMYWAEKTNELDYIIEEPIWEVYKFPFLSEKLCDMIVEEAENFGHWMEQDIGANTDSQYPSTDIFLDSLPGKKVDDTPLKDFYIDLQHQYVAPIKDRVWKWFPNHWDNYHFVSKYNPDKQAFVEPHHDDCICATVLSLNDGYEGGGTYFEKQKKLVSGKKGWCTLHPSRLTHRHGSKRVTKGNRYVLVSFLGNKDGNK